MVLVAQLRIIGEVTGPDAIARILAYVRAREHDDSDATRATVQKLYTGALGSLGWIEQRPLAEGPAALDELLNCRSLAAKVVLRPE